MSTSKFGFLPFLRKGLAKSITQVDDTMAVGNSDPERTVVPVTVKVDTPAPGTPTFTKQVQLVGPGDILSISRDVILRTEPANYVFNYESNMLPFVEFYEEDFLWRYSPAKEDGNKKLRPWLALVVLKDGEYVLNPPKKEGLPGFISFGQAFDLGTVLHPNKEHWAWGHVQLNEPDDSNPIQVLKNTAESKPDAAVCRLLSSRQLEPDTEYTAFLIPAFETGRLAGLGAATASVKSLLGSWDQTGQLTGYAVPGPGEFPVYHQWRFATSALGDFESLARKLKPVELDDSVGTRLLDSRRLGMGLEQKAAAVPNPADANNTARNGTVNLEGALLPAGTSYGAAQNATPSSASSPTAQDDFTTALKNVLNLQTELQQNNSAFGDPNPYGLGTNEEDPVILPPLYGQYHADEEKVGAGSPLWFQEANLDLRNRAAAGLGAQVVREKQEQFMELAWRQAGEVNAANEKIRKAQLAVAASKAIYEKHLVGKIDGVANSNSVTAPDKFERVLKIASPALKKMQTGNTGIVGLTKEYLGLSGMPTYNTVALQTSAATTAVTSGTVDSGFRKMSRSRSVKVRVADKSTHELTQGLEKSLDSNASVKAAGTFTPPVGSQSQQQYMSNPIVSNNNTSPANAVSIAAFPTGGTTSPDWVKYNTAQFVDFGKTYEHYKDLDAKDNPQRKSLIGQGHSHAFRQTIQTKLDPEVSVRDRVLAQIKLNAPATLDKIKPILAYPVIDLPMVSELVALSVQHLAPNLGEIPANSVTLLESNDRFIESYLLGLNHEFNRELLWREYPTDRRGTSFRVFWDKKDDLSGAAIDDIGPIHSWLSNSGLGEHALNGAQDIMVLCVRGDLLKKFPNALIYAQKANFGATQSSPRQLKNAIDYSNAFTPVGQSMVMQNDYIRMPVFRMDVQPDLAMIGFRLSREEARGLPANFPNNADAGWFFVFRERPGNIRFGLDGTPPLSTPPGSWDNLSWSHLGAGGNAQNVKVIKKADVPTSLFNLTIQNISWNGDAAQNAYILYRRPSLVAIHADNMIDG